jgi:opacity protein-like surface antigen
MSQRIATVAALFTAALLAGLAASASPAEAQCRRAWACSSLQISVGVSGGVYIGPMAPPPPPQVVYVQPVPQPPVVVYQPQPQVVYVQPQVQARAQAVAILPTAPALPEPTWGLHAELGAMGLRDTAMAGGGLALRLRPTPWFGVDLGVGSYGGVDAQDRDRVEVPFTANALFFVNPQSQLQLYVLGGLGVSYAEVGNAFGSFDSDDFFATRSFTHFGGQLGLGVEWRLSHHFALNTDLRGFVRTRTDDDGAPEFIDADTGNSTNTSGGLYWTAGATLYL